MINNLLFDLGGVIMDIRRDNCVDAFKKLGFENPEKFLDAYVQKGPFMQIEAGQISIEEFHKFLREFLPANVTDHDIDQAFMKFLIGIPKERLLQLQLLRQKYGIYMLSNTNPIMWNGFIKTEFEKDGLTREEYFDGIVTSFEAKSLKPSAEIFHYAEKKLGIKPEETLFLDDSQANVEAAMKLGFKGAVVPEGKEFYEVLAQQGLA